VVRIQLVLQLVTRGAGVSQQLLQNGLAEVLCNVIHSLHHTLSAKCTVDVLHADVQQLFSAIAQITYWYVQIICIFSLS